MFCCLMNELGQGERHAAALVTRWYRCRAASPPPSLPLFLPSSLPLSLLLSAPVVDSQGLCCWATLVLRFPQWSFEGNKTLPPRQTVTGTGEAWGRRAKGGDHRSSKTLFWFLTAPEVPPVWPRAVKFPRRTPQRRVVLLKLESYLLMTEHPAVPPEVAGLQGYADIC